MPSITPARRSANPAHQAGFQRPKNQQANELFGQLGNHFCNTVGVLDLLSPLGRHHPSEPSQESLLDQLYSDLTVLASTLQDS